jgi:hypothetical protein
MTFQLPYANKIKIPTALSFLRTTFKEEPQLWLWCLGGTFFYMLTRVKNYAPWQLPFNQLCPCAPELPRVYKNACVRPFTTFLPRERIAAGFDATRKRKVEEGKYPQKNFVQL